MKILLADLGCCRCCDVCLSCAVYVLCAGFGKHFCMGFGFGSRVSGLGMGFGVGWARFVVLQEEPAESTIPQSTVYPLQQTLSPVPTRPARKTPRNTPRAVLHNTVPHVARHLASRTRYHCTQNQHGITRVCQLVPQPSDDPHPGTSSHLQERWPVWNLNAPERGSAAMAYSRHTISLGST